MRPSVCANCRGIKRDTSCTISIGRIYTTPVFFNVYHKEKEKNPKNMKATFILKILVINSHVKVLIERKNEILFCYRQLARD